MMFTTNESHKTNIRRNIGTTFRLVPNMETQVGAMQQKLQPPKLNTKKLIKVQMSK